MCKYLNKGVYFSYVHSYLSYGAIIWSSAYQFNLGLHKLEILQGKKSGTEFVISIISTMAAMQIISLDILQNQVP